MSFRYLAWAQSAKTGSSSTKSVLMALCSIVNDDGIGFPSQQRIADDSELSIRTVKRAMDDLEKAGTISRERRYREGGYRTSDLIKVHQEPQILGAKLSRDTESGDTVSNLRCHSGIAEPVIEPVSIKATRGTRLHENFEPDESCHELAERLLLSNRESQEALENFVDYWKAVPGAKGLKLDWQATFRNQLRHVAKQKGKHNGTRTTPRPNSIAGSFAVVDAAIDAERRRIEALEREIGQPGEVTAIGGQGSKLLS